MARGKANGRTTGASLGFESRLWDIAHSLRGSADSAEHKRVVLALVFLKYISDRFDERHNDLVDQAADPSSNSHAEAPPQRGGIRMRAALFECRTPTALCNTPPLRLLSGELHIGEAEQVMGQRT